MPDFPADHDARMQRARLSLLGLSVGDAFGERFFLPATMAKRLIAQRTVPQHPWRYTDDTEMALSIVQVLGECGRIDPDRLAEAFAARYDPGRGYGGMAHVILRRLGAGHPWQQVSRAAFAGEGSMGNGGAMRSAPVGAYFADDLRRAAEEGRLSAEVTHAHPEGQAGATAVAVAAALAWQQRNSASLRPSEFCMRVAEQTPPGDTRGGLVRASKLPAGMSADAAAGVLGNGSQVTAPDTVPIAVWCAAHFRAGYADALWNTVSALGDRDTTCAIVGGIVALSVGEEGVPRAWIEAREPLPPV